MTAVADRCEPWLMEVQDHLRDELLPFWLTHGKDDTYGGYLTYFDRRGKPTGETVKTLLCHARMVYTYASVHRAGLGEGRFLELARDGAEFLFEHAWDPEYWGWYWTLERDGSPLNPAKLTYGQSFMLYALAEFLMASGDHRAMDWAVKTYEVLQTLAADNGRGGYYEFLERDWRLKQPGVYGGDRKSFDVHMHLMEAFTNFYEATGVEVYRRRTREMIDLIFTKVLHPEFGTGQAQFFLDWTPTRQILFKDVWGADRDADDEEGRPLNNTSFGHNVEFCWLLEHAFAVCDIDPLPYRDAIRAMYDHCVQYGIDWDRGGVYCEGPHDGPARERNKEFWQQAETMVGMLDAYATFGDPRYLDAYENVHRFVMDHVINHEVGEWFALLNEQNEVVWDYMATGWKINYHTVRAMLQCEQRLLRLVHGK